MGNKNFIGLAYSLPIMLALWAGCSSDSSSSAEDNLSSLSSSGEVEWPAESSDAEWMESSASSVNSALSSSASDSTSTVVENPSAGSSAAESSAVESSAVKSSSSDASAHAPESSALASSSSQVPQSSSQPPEFSAGPLLSFDFYTGADISTVQEYERNNTKFYDVDGSESDIFTILKKHGFNAIRLRTFVSPLANYGYAAKSSECGHAGDEAYGDKEHIIAYAKKVKAAGMAFLLDIHYSDNWADPGKQIIPERWRKVTSSDAMADSVYAYTKDLMESLKAAGATPEMVQIGNETRTGMLWPVGELTNEDPYSFCKLANAGYDAVKSVYPDATVLLHCDNAWDGSLQTWFWTLVGKGGAKYDMIGLSLYPSYWDDTLKAYPDWRPKCSSTILNIKQMHQTFNKPVMLVEFGMPESEPEKARDALQYLLDNVSGLDWFKGIFLWEPESEKSRNGYEYGAFSNGRPTSALDPFRQ